MGGMDVGLGAEVSSGAARVPDVGAASKLCADVVAVQDRLRSGTAASARGLPDLTGALGTLRRAGVLRSVLPPSMGGCDLGIGPGTSRPLGDLLRRIGRADLALARVIEGHVNAAILVEVHGDPDARDGMRRAVADGALLGVWGADGDPPMEWLDRHDGQVELHGAKRYASGLGHVDHALVTARAREGAPARMFLVPAGDPARHDHDAWSATAMRATRSGTFDATGMLVGGQACIGRAGDLVIEPWFEGGIWRYCAAHVGGAEGLIDLWVEHLDRTGRRGDPVQRSRLGRAMAATAAARACVEAAADAVDAAAGAPRDRIDSAVAQALLSREAVEMLCVEVLGLAERALGMAAHDDRLPIDRMRRDLSLFLRQAAPDAKLDRAVDLIARTGLGEVR